MDVSVDGATDCGSSVMAPFFQTVLIVTLAMLATLLQVVVAMITSADAMVRLSRASARLTAQLWALPVVVQPAA